MSLIDLYIKDNSTGRIHRIGDNQYDMLVVDDEDVVRYKNLQTGEGSKYGGYSFVPNTDKCGYPFNPMEANYDRQIIG